MLRYIKSFFPKTSTGKRNNNNKNIIKLYVLHLCFYQTVTYVLKIYIISYAITNDLCCIITCIANILVLPCVPRVLAPGSWAPVGRLTASG